MSDRDFSEVVDEIMHNDPRYAKNAYFFIRRVLDYTVRMVAARSKRPVGHISGTQMLEGFRQYTLEQFGPMSLTVLENWGVRETEDVGNVVFNLVESGVLGKNQKDSIADFRDKYRFSDAFERPFAPKKRH